MGFSHRTWSPASSAAMVASRCATFGVQTETASSDSFSSISWYDAYQRGMPNSWAVSSARSGTTSHTATISTPFWAL